MHLNVEIKARARDIEKVRTVLARDNAVFKGIDSQTDTYFNVRNGRLKLRQGNIENNLIQYDRQDQAGPKESRFRLVKIDDAEGLKEALTAALGIKVVVTKIREIFFIGNIKFHIDEIPGLGNFIEIEAGNLMAPDLDKAALEKQCSYYQRAFGILPEDLLTQSYSDLLS